MNTTNWLAQGHLLRGPVADLVALKDGKGNPHTGVLFPEDWCDHKALHTIPPPGSSGNVTGVAPLIDADLGALVYAGGGRTVHELAAILRDEEEDFGLKGTLELAIELVKIVHAAHKAGLGPHRGMTPWRIIIAPNGAVSILGWGLRQLDMEDFLEDEDAEPSADSLRYCPPERMEDAEEDESTDRYTALLIAIEVWLGEPIYNGVFQDILPQIEDGKASQLLPEMPESADLAFATALGSYPEDRHDSADACLADLQAAYEEATGPSLAELYEMADGFASPREVSLSSAWQWPDGEPEGGAEAAPAPAKPGAARSVEVPDEVRPWLDAANEAADRAEKAAERAGQAADEATDQALRSADGVEAALDSADEAADTALDEAERARNAATACEAAKDEATATAHAETAKQAATRAEDAAHDARAAADNALDCSKAHLEEQRKELEERLAALEALVDGWETPAAPTLQFGDVDAVQQASAAADQLLEQLEEAQQRAQEALSRAKDCDTSDTAAEPIEAFEAANAQRADVLVALTRAYDNVLEADRGAAKGRLNEAEATLEAAEAALADHLTSYGSAANVPESLADAQQTFLEAEQAVQERLQGAREAHADQRVDDVLRLVNEAGEHLGQASAARQAFAEALDAWNSQQLNTLAEAADRCREAFNAWETPTDTGATLPDQLAAQREALTSALGALQSAVEDGRTALTTLCASDRSIAERAEAASEFERVSERYQAALQQWEAANEAANNALAEQEQLAAMETLRSNLRDQLQAALQVASDRLAAIDNNAIQSGNEGVDSFASQRTEAVSNAEAAMDSARQLAEHIASASAEALAEHQDNVPSICEGVTDAAAAAQAADQRLQSAIAEASEERARRLEALQQQVAALVGAAQQLNATRQSTFEAARATTRPAGPKMAMAWDAVEEANEELSEALSATISALQDAPSDIGELERITAAAQTSMDQAASSMQEMTTRVTDLEEAARTALEEAERIGAARQSADALAVEVQGLQAPDSVSTDGIDDNPEVTDASTTLAAASNALDEARRAAQEAIQSVAQVVDAAEAEALLEAAREHVATARTQNDAAREAAQALAGTVDRVRAQQRQLEASREVLSETQGQVRTLLDQLSAPLEIEAWVSLADAIAEHDAAARNAQETLQSLIDDIASMLAQAQLDGEAIPAVNARVVHAEDAMRAHDERRQRLSQQHAERLQEREVLCERVSHIREQVGAHTADVESLRALWTEHFGGAEEALPEAVSLSGQLDKADQRLQELQPQLVELAEHASSSLDLEATANALDVSQQALQAIALPEPSEIASLAASAQQQQLTARVEAALDEAIAQVPPFDALDIMIGEIAPESLTAATLEGLHAARDAARAAGQAVTGFELPQEEAALLEAPAMLGELTARCLEAFQAATAACSEARDEAASRAARATEIRTALDAILLDTPWDEALDQVPTEAQRQAPEQADALAATLRETREAFDVLTQPADMLPEGLEDREAYLAQAQASANVYHQGLATLQEALQHLAALQQAAQEAFAADTATITAAIAAFDERFGSWHAPEALIAEDALPEPLSAGWARWCEAHAQAKVARETAQQLLDARADGESGAPVQDAVDGLDASIGPARDARTAVHAVFVEAAEALSAEARAIVLPDVMPLLDNASEALQAATAEMEGQRAAADATKATLEQTLEQLRATPTPQLWSVLAQCSAELTTARDLLNASKDKVDKAFKEDASPTQRLQRRQMRLERLRIQREEERQRVAAAAEDAQAEASTSAPESAEANTPAATAAPNPEARPRRRRRPDADAAAAPEDGMRRRRRRRREGDEAAPASGEPRRRRRRRSEGEEPVSAAPAGPVDRSSRMERLRARRARQRETEADAGVATGAEGTPAVAEPPRRRRRRRPEGDDGGAADGAPRRQRRRRRREEDEN